MPIEFRPFTQEDVVRINNRFMEEKREEEGKSVFSVTHINPLVKEYAEPDLVVYSDNGVSFLEFKANKFLRFFKSRNTTLLSEDALKALRNVKFSTAEIESAFATAHENQRKEV